MRLLEQWVQGVVATSPPPPLQVTGVIAAGVLLLVLARPSWRPLRHGVTIVHEAGHAAVATVTGRRLAGIRVHSDTSGLTVTVGKPRGPGMTATLLAGYPAPCVAGVLAALAVAAGHGPAVPWAALVLLLAVLVQIRNWYGLLSVLVGLVVVGAATWLLPALWRGRFAVAIVALLVFGGARAVTELPAARRRGRRSGSDADQLATVTRVPAVLWVALFGAIAIAGVLGAALLLWRGLPF